MRGPRRIHRVKMNHPVSRRHFIFSGALAAGALSLGGCATVRGPRPVSANGKLDVGVIGCGGKGWTDLSEVAGCGENIVALCDVDENSLHHAAKKFPGAKLFRDYRKMLDEFQSLDAVTVSTPDHHHFPAAMRAMARGLHVYVQKPLTHTIWEARQMAIAAREHRVATQMGNQGTSGAWIRETCELIWSGAIGDVTEVHVWTDRPIWPQGKDRPAGEDPVPKNLDWDLWLGPAPVRPFKQRYADVNRDVYHPFCWRGWWDFGTGALGDIACHSMNAPMWALNLGAPLSAEVVQTDEVKKESFPNWSILRWDFPARPEMSAASRIFAPGQAKVHTNGPGTLPAVKMFWYDGGKRPPIVPEMERREWDDNGTLYVGTKGKIYKGRLLPESLMKDFKRPDPTIARVPNENHYKEWVNACKGGQPGCSNFDFAGPLTETVLLGNVALRLGRKVTWDAKHLRVPDCPEAATQIRGEYRKGWESV